MVGFMKGLGCGCCGCPTCQFSESSRPHSPPQSGRYFTPQSSFPLTEPFNNSAPVDSNFYALHSHGGAWAACTVGNTFNPNKSAYSGTIGNKIAEAVGIVYLFTGTQCNLLNLSFDMSSEPGELEGIDPAVYWYAPFSVAVNYKSTSNSAPFSFLTNISSDVNGNLSCHGSVIETFPQGLGTQSRTCTLRVEELADVCEIEWTVGSLVETFEIEKNTLGCACSLEFRITTTAYRPATSTKIQSAIDDLYINPNL